MSRPRGIRVIAGTARGRRLRVPPGDIRPTADRVKEAVFSALDARGLLLDAAVLDLWAGSGALAIEALSRGAARAVLVDRDPHAAATIASNLADLGFGTRARVERRDVVAYVVGPPPGEAPFDLVFCDPPYDLEGDTLRAVLTALVAPGWLTGAATVVIERPRGAPPPPAPGLRVSWERAFGDTLVILMSA